MGKFKDITGNLCASCKYRCKLSGMGQDGKIVCNYIEISGRSRIFENGEKVVPDGKCDKYRRGQESITSSRRWCDAHFMAEIGIHREGVQEWQT